MSGRLAGAGSGRLETVLKIKQKDPASSRLSKYSKKLVKISEGIYNMKNLNVLQQD